MVHFWNNRTIGCTGDECEACGKNRAKFWEGYFAALQANTLARLIVRVTEKIGGQINLWLANHKTMRGAQLELDRPSRTPNGRIRLQIAEGLADVPDRIVEPDMHKLLCHIWRLEKMPDRGVEPLPTSIEFDKLERNFARANGRKRIQPGV
jgi:hypothetical protein